MLMSASRRTGARRGLALAATAGFAAAMVVPASGMAAKHKFGSELDSSVQPSNSSTARVCDEQQPGATCTLVMNEAYGRPDGGELAPVKGKLKRIKLIAGESGKFRLQITRAREVNGVWETKVVRKGPVIHYEGQNQTNWDTDTYNVEKFKVNLKIRKGDRLGMKTKANSAYRCSSGGDNTLIHTPHLTKSDGYQPVTSDEGCWMLLEGVIKTKN